MLVSRAHEGGHKLQFSRLGPKRIRSVFVECVYMLGDLHCSRAEKVHAKRLIFYSDNFPHSQVLQEWLDIAERTEARYKVEHNIKAIDEADDGRFVQF